MNTPNSSRSRPVWLVLCAGLATSMLALLGVFLLGRAADDWHIMGWYANYVIPAGAILVGLVASSGYGVASWRTGLKMTRGLLGVVLLLQVLVYFAAQHIEYQQLQPTHRDGSPVSFVEYYDWTARSFAWKESNGSTGSPLGAWGYLFMGLQLVGFCAGSLIVPAFLWRAPYCQKCQVYMRTRRLATIPASVARLKKLKKSDTAGLAALQVADDAALAAARAQLESLCASATGNRVAEMTVPLAELARQKKANRSLPRVLVLEMVSCRSCADGYLRATAHVAQPNNQWQITEISRLPLPPETVQRL